MIIIVKTEEEKQKLLKESKYIHDSLTLDVYQANTLMHIYLNPNMIRVEDNKGFSSWQ